MASPIDDAESSSITFDYKTNCNGHRPRSYNARFFKVKEVIRQRFADGRAIGVLFCDVLRDCLCQCVRCDDVALLRKCRCRQGESQRSANHGAERSHRNLQVVSQRLDSRDE
jgi:hypothetical protein